MAVPLFLHHGEPRAGLERYVNLQLTLVGGRLTLFTSETSATASPSTPARATSREPSFPLPTHGLARALPPGPRAPLTVVAVVAPRVVAGVDHGAAAAARRRASASAGGSASTAASSHGRFL